MKLSSIYDCMYAVVYSTGHGDEVELVTNHIFKSFKEAEECMIGYEPSSYLDLRVVKLEQFNELRISNR